MNHKRRRPKHQRAGCLLCKPHKLTGKDKPSVQRQATATDIGEEPDEFMLFEGDCVYCGGPGCLLPSGQIDDDEPPKS